MWVAAMNCNIIMWSACPAMLQLLLLLLLAGCRLTQLVVRQSASCELR